MFPFPHLDFENFVKNYGETFGRFLRVFVRGLFFGNELFFAAHVRTKCFGDVDGTVCIEIVFKESDQHTGRSNNGVVQ